MKNEEVNLIKQGRCPLCKQYIIASEFYDGPSRKEYSISGMCQSCQDDVLGSSEATKENRNAITCRPREGP